MKTTHRICISSLGLAVLASLLAACSPNPHAPTASTVVVVQAVMPARHTFHTRVAAVGQLAADSRGTLSLSLPQAGRIGAVEVMPEQAVKRGEVLLRLVTSPAARSAYLQARVAVKTANQALARTERLRSAQLATNAQVGSARQALADAQATLAAQARLGGATASTVLKAPSAGVVTSVDVQRGQRVSAGARLVAFSPHTALVARLGVNPAAAGGIHAGMQVSLQPVYAAHGTPPLTATVAMVGDAVNPATHRVDLVATLGKATSWPEGTALTAHITTAHFTAWAVPRDALQDDAQGPYLFQIEHGKAKRVDVTVVDPHGSPIGVAGTIDPDAPVITLGSYEVTNGDAVQTAAAPTARAAAR
ncbi:MAG TPA: efflux RND transporter periplasmic adaptor subunit [Nevskiaceae bacterium]|nr:efflux RND transporter periplasmic adaptor subunit [Nevskiaceae bacterium]